MKNVRSFVALVHICCRTIVTVRLNVDGLTILPSLHVFGRALHITAIGGGLNVKRQGHYHTVLVSICNVRRSFFGRVSTDVGHGYHGTGSVGGCLLVFRNFDRSLVVLVNGLVR